MKVVFDTNVFRDVQRGRITEADVSRAVERLQSSDEGFISPLSLIELGSHINNEEQEDFARYQVALKAAMRLCRFALPDPEAILRQQVFRAPPDTRGLSPVETLEISRLIAIAPTYDALVSGQIARWEGALARVSYNAGHLKKFREDYEGQYVIDMHDWVVGLVCPTWKEKRAAGEMANLDDDNLRKQVVQLIDSPEFVDPFYQFQAVRAGVYLLGNSPWDLAASERMKHFIDAYRWILRNIVNSGYNPEKNKNDFNDIHFLLYLADSEKILVSGDGGIARKVGDKSRVMTFSDWLSS